MTVDELVKNSFFLKALSLFKAGDINTSCETVRLLTDLDFDQASTWNLLGAGAFKLGAIDAAASFLTTAADSEPQRAIHWYNIAQLHIATGNATEAEIHIHKALSLTSDSQMRIDIAKYFSQISQRDKAIDLLRSVILTDSDNADALCILGTLLMDQGDFETSESALYEALRIRPDFPEALNNLALVKSRSGRKIEAEQLFVQAIHLKSDVPEFHSNFGDLLRELGRYKESETSCRRALSLDDSFVSAHVNLGNALREQGRFADAIPFYQFALDKKPDYPEVLNNYGGLMFDLGRPVEAVQHLGAAVLQRPEYVEAHVNLAMALLLSGRFREGWSEYEWRWRKRQNLHDAARFGQPKWNGEAIGDRTLLIHAEQGLGDTIQFCRYIPYMSAGHRVILEVQAELKSLLEGQLDVEMIVPLGDTLPAFDLHCPMLSLPRIFGTVLQTIPNRTPYIKADSARVRFWRERLAGLSGLNVGIAWAGNPAMGADQRRSIELQQFASIADLPGINLVSLQKGGANLDRLAPDLAVWDWTNELVDFADTAALVYSLDLVISVDTAVAHLAGALGRPIWLLNRYDRCWRWLLGREDSPWYPSLRQFRQTEPGDWTGVMERVRMELTRLSQTAILSDHPFPSAVGQDVIAPRARLLVGGGG